jgi:hypothetical protein
MAATTRHDESAAEKELEVETEIAQATGVTSPVSWWLLGLVGLLALAVVLFAFQFLGGNRGTDVVPGTPIATSQPAG